MGFFRFRRSIKIAPGIRWNFGKKSSSFSFGARGFKLTAGTRGIRGTVGIPGTGASYTKVFGSHSSQKLGPQVPQNTRAATGAPLGCGVVAVAFGFIFVLFIVGTVSKSCRPTDTRLTPESPSIAELSKELDYLESDQYLVDYRAARGLPPLRPTLYPLTKKGAIGLEAERAPRFRVVGSDLTTLGIVVPAETTLAQLVALVNSFHNARLNGHFADLFQPATPNRPASPRSVVEVFVFADPLWATSAKLHGFLNPKTVGVSDSAKAFGKHIRAHYLRWGAGVAGDTGSIGYANAEGYTFSAPYKILFINGAYQRYSAR